MEPIEFTVELKTGELYRFTMRHTYFSFSGVFGVLISLVSLFLCIAQFKNFAPATVAVLLLVATLFTIVQPIMLYVKCAAQIRRSKEINKPLHYIISDEGIRVQQEEEEAKVYWYQIRRVVCASQGIYVYMSPVRAFIFPKSQCGGQFEKIGKEVRRMVEKYRDYDPEQEESQQEDTHDGADISQ